MLCKTCKKEYSEENFVSYGKIRLNCEICRMKKRKYIRKCEYKNCKTIPIYNFKKETQGKFCLKHKKPNMINVVDKLCEYPNCIHLYSFKGKKGKFCKEHKDSDMVKVKKKKCEYKNCTITPTFNFKNETKGRFCSKHKQSGMIDVENLKCEYKLCLKQPNYNFKDEIKGRFCFDHKQAGMIDIKNKKCNYIGCLTMPTYNFKGLKERKFCAKHKEPNMVNIKDKICEYKDCITIANYNIKTEKKGKYCAKHKKSNMINVKSKLCEYIGCSSQPMYNFRGKKTGRFCVKHKLENMIDVKHKLCDICDIRACYGIPTNQPTKCFRHKQHNMIKDPTKRCITKNCKEIAIYGINITKHCKEHKEDEEICLVERECKKCKIIDILSNDELCINFCEPSKVYEQYKKYRKHKQLRVQKILTERITEPDRIEQIIDPDCGLERVDFMYDCKTHNICVEPDEFQHKDRCQLGEFNRMKNLFFSLGQNIPLIFIRYNPDNYRVNGILQKISQNKREDELVRWVKHYMENIPEDICSVLYLFYDEYSQENVKIFPFDPYNTKTFSCDKCDKIFYIESMFDDHTH